MQITKIRFGRSQYINGGTLMAVPQPPNACQPLYIAAYLGVRQPVMFPRGASVVVGAARHAEGWISAIEWLLRSGEGFSV
jgi:hypothetical protein